MNSETSSPTEIEVTDGRVISPSSPETPVQSQSEETGVVDEEFGEYVVECQAVLNGLDAYPLALRVYRRILGRTLYYTDYAIADDGTYISRIGHPRFGETRWVNEQSYQDGIYRENILGHVESESPLTFVRIDDEAELLQSE